MSIPSSDLTFDLTWPARMTFHLIKHHFMKFETIAMQAISLLFHDTRSKHWSNQLSKRVINHCLRIVSFPAANLIAYRHLHNQNSCNLIGRRDGFIFMLQNIASVKTRAAKSNKIRILFSWISKVNVAPQSGAQNFSSSALLFTLTILVKGKCIALWCLVHCNGCSATRWSVWNCCKQYFHCCTWLCNVKYDIY